MTYQTLGIKAGKYAAIFASLSVPGLNVVMGAYLLASLILSVASVVDRAPSFKPLSFLATAK